MANEIPAGGEDLDTQWEKVMEVSRILRGKIPGAIVDLGSTVDKAWIFSLVATTNKALDRLQELVDLPTDVRADLQDYARTRKRDATFDLTAGGGALRAAVTAVNDYVATTFPQDGSGYILAEKIERDQTSSGSLHIVPREITSTPARNALAALLQAAYDLTTA